MSARMRIEMVNVRNRREVMLERPPFCLDGDIWKRAVNQTRELKRRGSKGEPFLLATTIYRQFGGTFA